MLILGAKGFAKEILEILHINKQLKHLAFYDDISSDLPDKLFEEFQIINSIDEAKTYFNKVDNKFTIGIGKPILRKKLKDKFTAIGGDLVSTISSNASIGSYDVVIGKGCNILAGAILSNSVVLGEGCMIYYNVLITHDCEINDYVEISPGVIVLGRVKVGSYTQLGAGSVILPDIEIGNNVIIGAGTIVTKNVPNNSVIAGVPGKFIRKNIE